MQGAEGPNIPGPAVDEFASYDFSEFTEEDFARIDAEIARKHPPHLAIAYEISSTEPSILPFISRDKRRKGEESPLNRYRSRGILYVTDLASPSWCEMQFEYGLQGKRSRPLHQRPKSFKSASGKEIKADKSVAAKNDVVISKGAAIHKALERVVKPQEMSVDIASSEERWGLRLVNMLSCLKGIQLDGFTREMPVFGTEGGEVIVGIIDELVYQPVSTETDGVRQATDLSRTPLENCFSSAPTGNQETVDRILDESVSSINHKLQIVDTKTRKKDQLPPLEDMFPARVQLMLYHRLLSRLVSPEHPFDFMSFWKTVGVDPARQFSTRFLAQAGLITGHGEFEAHDLLDLSVLWQDLVHQLHITGVDDELKLIYRLQSYKRQDHTPDMGRAVTAEEVALVRAIAASLYDASQPPVDTTGSGEGAASSSNPDQAIAKNEDAILPTVEGKEVAGPQTTDTPDGKYQTIGMKVFQYDPDLLSAHITDILEWWRGGRRPRGVPIELSYRCRTCEYHNDCEWREAQAKEFREQAEMRREVQIVPGM